MKGGGASSYNVWILWQCRDKPSASKPKRLRCGDSNATCRPHKCVCEHLVQHGTHGESELKLKLLFRRHTNTQQKKKELPN